MKIQQIKSLVPLFKWPKSPRNRISFTDSRTRQINIVKKDLKMYYTTQIFGIPKNYLPFLRLVITSPFGALRCSLNNCHPFAKKDFGDRKTARDHGITIRVRCSFYLFKDLSRGNAAVIVPGISSFVSCADLLLDGFCVKHPLVCNELR